MNILKKKKMFNLNKPYQFCKLSIQHTFVCCCAPLSRFIGETLRISKEIYIYIYIFLGVRCCDTKRKVAGSIPAGVIGIFH